MLMRVKKPGLSIASEALGKRTTVPVKCHASSIAYWLSRVAR